MAANKLPRAKRANKPNPREDRNQPYSERNPHGHREDDYMSMKPKKRVELLPRNIAQENYVDALLDMDTHIVFAMGPAGTGKTMLATQYAIKGLLEGTYQKIVITRPAVGADGESHGYLPGTLLEKMAPWVLPIMDVFKEHFSVQQVEKMIANEVIEVSPLAYMRGRTLKHAFILCDEMQNSTVSQMKMLLTRIGENSRMAITGDLKQHDRGYDKNGLGDFVERMKNNDYVDGIEVIEFGCKDVERHSVIESILKIYGDE